MKKILAIFFVIMISLTTAFSAVTTWADDPETTTEDGEDPTDPEDPTEPTTEPTTDPTEPTTDPAKDDKDKDKDVSNTADAIIECPPGDGDEYKIEVPEHVEVEGRISDWVIVTRRSSLPKGELPEESTEHQYVNGVCQDCGLIRDGLACVKGKWGYFKDGKLDTEKNGLVYGNIKGTSAWYLIQNGRYNPGTSEIVFGDIRGEEAYWCVKNGRITEQTGLLRIGADIWYVQNGRVNRTYTGILRDADGLWYLRCGRVVTEKTGVVRTSSGDFFINKGKVDFDRDSVELFEGEWRPVMDGRVNYTYSGLADNANGRWAIKEGKVDFEAKGIVRDETGYYYVAGGKVDYTFNGFASDEYNMYYVVNGRVDTKQNGRVKGIIEGEEKEVPLCAGMVISEEQYNMTQMTAKYDSETDWLLMIDTTANRVGIFHGSQGNWELKYYWICTTGAAATPTVLGEFEITDNRGYCFSDKDYTCYYFSGFYGPYLFHSTLMYRNTLNDLNPTLGYNESHGCVRLTIQNAKWLFYNIPTGSKVIAY